MISSSETPNSPPNTKRQLYKVDQQNQFVTKTGQVIYLEGCRMKPSYDPSLCEGLENAWKSLWLHPWQPIYKRDLQLIKDINILKNIVHRVKNYNESRDIGIFGDRGSGKSSLAVGLAIQLHNLFTNGKSQFPIEQVCFSIEEYVAVTNNLKGTGGVVVMDEIGLEGSLSSRTSMSKENRATADLVQLSRTDRIITILISLDRDRVDKRVRQTNSILMTPLRKLNHEQTGCGLAIEADVKLRYTRPATQAERGWRSENDSGYLVHDVTNMHYAKKGLLYSLVISHPPVGIWQAYGEKRDKRLEQVRERAFLAYNAEEDAAVAVARSKTQKDEPAQVQEKPKSKAEILSKADVITNKVKIKVNSSV